MARVALVTGGAGGIGLAIARMLAADHAVAVTYLSSDPAGLPADITAIRADLAEPGAAADVVARVIARFGRLDVLVHNAGLVGGGRAGEPPAKDHDPAALRRMFEVNLFAADALLAAALPHMPPGSAVVAISSVNAVLPPRGAAMYGASKAALDLWLRGMAKELGPRGIRVNGVAPGPVDVPGKGRPPELIRAFTDLIALGRMGRPEDIARAVRFLVSDEASFITGEVLNVSGGYRL